MKKILKTLLPIATLGATAACIVPMASCSKAYLSTSDVNFKPDKQYKDGQATEIKDAAGVQELTTAYFADSKIFAQDYAYVVSSEIKKEVEDAEAKKTQGEIESYDIHYSLSINSYSLTEKELDLGGIFGKIKGYILNATVNGSVYSSITYAKNTELKIQRTKIEDSTYSATISNAFVALNPYTFEISGWTFVPGILCLGHKDLDWSVSLEYTQKDTTLITLYETGASRESVSTYGNKTSTNRQYYGEDLYPMTSASIDHDESYFMEKVTFNVPTPSIK